MIRIKIIRAKKFLAFLSAGLACLMLLSPLISAASAGFLLSDDSVSLSHNSLDYSDSENFYAHRAVLSPSDLLLLVLRASGSSDSLCEAEADYLDTYYDEYLFYSDRLSGDLISVQKTEQGVTVVAQIASYTGENGRIVTYLPVLAEYNGVKTDQLVLSADQTSYTAFFDRSLFSDYQQLSGQATVTYNGSLTLPLTTVNKLINFAFSEAQGALAADKTLTDYTLALSEYRAYLQALEDYKEQKQAYEEYTAAKELYDKACAAYEKNILDWKDYNEQKKLYDIYDAACQKYQSDMQTYQKDYEEYERASENYTKYLNNLSAIRTSMIPMESLFIKPEEVNSLYKALQNSELVSMFEKYQSVLTSTFGVPESDIREIRACSDALNALLVQYAEQRKVSEEAAFLFYKSNYSEINYRFNYLYGKMNSIMTPSVYTLMCGKLELEYGKEQGAYKKWRIKNVLSHIYLICLCLDDARQAEGTWTFYNDKGDEHTYYFGDLLDPSLIISDTDAANPTALVWMPVAEQKDPPTLPPEPTPEIQKPIPPPVLSDPGEAPPEVEEPTEPTEVSEPEAPNEGNHALRLRTDGIRVALNDGQIPEREELTEEITVTVGEISLTKNLLFSQENEAIPCVTVYGTEGEVLSVNYPQEPLPCLAESYEDECSVYAFLGWSSSPDSLEEPPEAIEEELCLYPLYQRSPKSCTVRFSVNGTVVSEQEVPWGEVPVFDGATPDKESSETVDYVFSTWYPTLSAVREDTLYEARYMETERIYTVTFSVRGQQLFRYYKWREEPVAPVPAASYIEKGVLYEFSAWDKELTEVTENTCYTALYEQTVLASLPEESEGDGQGRIEVTAQASCYRAEVSGNGLSFSNLLSRCVHEGKRLELLFTDSGTEVVLDQTAVEGLTALGARSAVLLQDESKGIAIFFSDGEEKLISPRKGELRLKLSTEYGEEDHITIKGTHTNGLFESNVSYSIKEGNLELIVKANVYYQVTRRFSLTCQTGENGSAYIDASLYKAGDKVTLTVRPNANYYAASVLLINIETGESVSVDPKNLVMPEYNALLKIEFLPIEFTVEFIYEGGSTVQKQKMGETVTFPEIPISFEKDGYFYTFTGWSSSASIVTGDMRFTAKYYCIPIDEKSDSGEGGAWGVIIRKYILPAALIAIVILSAMGTALTVWIKKRKKRAKKT